MPNFNEMIIEAVEPYTQGYFNMTDYNSKFQYTDGNHIFKESSEMATEVIANWILSKQNTQCK